MATSNKDFRIKNGLIVDGASATVNGNNVITSGSSINDLNDVVITDPSTGQVIKWNGTAWVNDTDATGEAGPQGEQGIQGEVGATGPAGADGDDGVAVQAEAPTNTDILWLDTDEVLDIPVPPGGTTGQVLTKASSANYDSAWSTPVAAGLQLVKTQTIGTAVTSVTVNDAFSADYDNYKIIISGGVGSVNAPLRIALGSSTTGYYWVRRDVLYATAADNTAVGNNDSLFSFIGRANTSQMNLCAELGSPFLSSWTNISSGNGLSSSAGNTNGVHQVASSFSDFTLSPATGNITGGTIRVYGYKKE